MRSVNCHMGKRSLIIDPYGDVYPCGGGQIDHLHDLLCIGNLQDFNGDLDLLLAQDKALFVLKNI